MRVGVTPRTNVFIRRKRFGHMKDTFIKGTSEWLQVSQGTPKVLKNHRRWEEERKSSFLICSETACLFGHLHFRLVASRTKSVSNVSNKQRISCQSSLRKLTHLGSLRKMAWQLSPQVQGLIKNQYKKQIRSPLFDKFNRSHKQNIAPKSGSLQSDCRAYEQVIKGTAVIATGEETRNQ